MNTILKWAFKFSAQHWERTLNSQRVTKVSTHSFVHISNYTVGIHKLTSKTNVKNLLQNKLYILTVLIETLGFSVCIYSNIDIDISNKNCTVVNIIKECYLKKYCGHLVNSLRDTVWNCAFAIMPRRGQFWGFGTQGPHWKKIKSLGFTYFHFACFRFILIETGWRGQEVSWGSKNHTASLHVS